MYGSPCWPPPAAASIECESTGWKRPNRKRPSGLPQVNFRVGRGWGFQPQRLKNCGWKPQSQDFSQPENQAALDYFRFVNDTQFECALVPSEKTRAIVLRVIDFSESSCVVTLFTRDFGKIGGLAKGARRPKSPFDAALDLLAVCRIVFLHKSSDALDLLTEAKLDRRFRAATRDLSRLYAGYYVAELIKELTDAGDPHPELFDAADAALVALDGESDVRRVVLRFEMTALRELGHSPSLGACVECGRAMDVKRRMPFGLLAGGLLCAEHREGKRRVVGLTSAAVDVLQCFAAEDEAWQDKTVEPRTWGEVRGLLNQYFSHLVGRKLRMQSHLGAFVG